MSKGFHLLKRSGLNIRPDGITFLLLLPLSSALIYSSHIPVVWFLTAMISSLLFLRGAGNFIATSDKLWPKTVFMLLLLGFSGMQLGRFLSFYFQGESFNQRFFFHFSTNSLAEAGTAYLPLYYGTLIYLLMVIVAGLRKIQKKKKGVRKPAKRIITESLTLLIMAILVDPDLRHWVQWHKSLQFSNQTTLEAIDFDTFSLNQGGLNDRSDSSLPGRNLVFIY